MSAKIILTADGSNSLFSEQYKEQYHSVSGAVTESQHIYIDRGLRFHKQENSIAILEVGFGTGLNALLTLMAVSKNTNLQVDYIGIEKFPLSKELYSQLNYAKYLKIKPELFTKIHEIPQNAPTPISQNFRLTKIYADIKNVKLPDSYDLVYFDAFSPERQAELWTKELFQRIFKNLSPNGALLTYSSKGTVKQALRQAGFKVKRLSGPKGKHHIIRAEKHGYTEAID